MNAHHLRDLLEVRYAPKYGWLLCDEVGGSFGRRVDLIAFNLWHSRGFGIEGFELKASRYDWQQELANPAKADEGLYRYCDYWWLVTAPGVVKEIEEIPETWGWIEAKNDRLYTKRKAPKLDPKPVSRAFMAAMVKRYEGGVVAAVERTRRELYDVVYQQVENQQGETLRREREQFQRLQTRMQEYERLIGRLDESKAKSVLELADRLTHPWQGLPAKLNTAKQALADAAVHLEQVQAYVNSELTA